MSRFSIRSSANLKHLVVVGVGILVCLFQFGDLDMVFADNHAKVRMYKTNTKGQHFLQRWVKHEEDSGCHSSSRDRKVNRFSQTGYNFCQLYSKEGCLPGSEVPAMWGGKRYRVADIDIKQPQIKLLQGTKWMLAADDNALIRSWYCEY